MISSSSITSNVVFILFYLFNWYFFGHPTWRQTGTPPCATATPRHKQVEEDRESVVIDAQKRFLSFDIFKIRCICRLSGLENRRRRKGMSGRVCVCACRVRK